MKRILSLTLALMMVIPMILGALPQFTFAESTQLAETTDGYASYIYYGGGIRAKSDKSILFSPYMTDVKAAVAAGASLSDYTVKMTFSLLSEEDGEEVFTFDSVCAALNSSNGQYYDIYLNGSKGNSGFCPTAGCYYNVYIEVITGFGTENEEVAFHGTYKNAYAADAIANSTAYYFPTSTAKEMSETGEGSGLRKKSDGRIMFSPRMDDLRAEITAGKAYEDFTVKATFSLLSDDDSVSYTFPTYTLQPMASNGSYVDMVLKSDTVDTFCPEAGKSYKIDVEILYNSVSLYIGTYEKITAKDAIADSEYYAPTETVAELTDYTLYKNGIRKNSAGNIMFSPIFEPARTDIINGSSYTVKAVFTLLDADGNAEYTYPVAATMAPKVANHYVDMVMQSADYDCGFCPEAGKSYNIDVEVYEGTSLRYKGTYENVVALDAIAESASYNPTKKGIEITETTVYSTGIRKNSAGNVMFSPFIAPLRDEIAAGAATTDYTIKLTFAQLNTDGSVYHTFETATPYINPSSNGKYFDLVLKSSSVDCGFCPTAGNTYDVYLEVFDKNGVIKYYGTYEDLTAPDAITGSNYYLPTAIPGQPAEFDISLSYSFNNDLSGSAAGNIYFTVDKAGYFEIRWADSEGKPLTATVGTKTLPYGPLSKISITNAAGGSYMEKMIGFTVIPQDAAKLIVTDSAKNVLKTLDIPTNKQLTEEDYKFSFGTISDLHYNYFWLDDAKTQDAAIPAVDNALAFYEAAGVNLITAVGDYSLYNEENSYQKYQAAVSKITTPVLACAGNHEVYTHTGDSMYAPGGYWLTYMNNGFYDGTVEGVLDIADNGVDLSYSIPGLDDYVFISLNQWYYDNHTTTQESLLEDDQLTWLAEQFETYKDKTVYLLFHTYLGDDDFETIDGQGDMTNPGGYTYGSFYNQYTDDEAILRGLLEKYENVVWFNGHSHYEYSIQKYNENLNIFDYYGTSATMVHIPSVTNMRTVSDTSTGYSSMYRTGASQGALTLVYDGYQIINAVDLQNEEILSFATFIVYDNKTTTGTIEGTDITWTYDEQLNSLRFDGTGAMPDYEAATDAPFAAYMSTVKTVYVADGITAVGANTFNGYTALTTVSLKDDVASIGENAFKDTAITKLTLPRTLQTVSDGAFDGITSTIAVTYYGSSTQWAKITIGENNEALTGATVSCRTYTITFDIEGETTDTDVAINKVPSYDGERPTKEHEDPNKFYVFAGWTDGTTTYAAGQELPKATKDVSYTAVFTESSEERLATGTIGTITWAFDKMTGVLTVSGTGATPNWTNNTKSEWHTYADMITEVVVTEGITTIGSYSFSGLKNLSKVTLPEGLTTLNADAFSYNSSLKSLVLPSTLKTVGQGVTYQTNNITTIYYGCGADAWNTLVASITALYNDSLKNASPVFSHEGTLECTATDETHTYFCAECSFSITAKHSFGESVPGAPGTLEKKCDCGYTKVEYIVVTDTIGTITWSLDQTTGVLTISGVGATPIWTNDTKSEWHAYADLISKVIVEEGITTIGNYAFSGLKNVTEVVLPSTVEAVNADAFSYDPALKILHLPASLTFVGQGVLFGTNSVTTAYFGGCAHQWATMVAGITSAYNDNLKNATPVCAKTGTTCIPLDNDAHAHVCVACNATVSTGSHTEGEITEIKATVYAPGGKFYTCPDCGEEVTVETYEQITAIGGDINMDGTVTIADVTKLLDYLAVSSDTQNEWIETKTIHAEALDTNGDETITIGDVTRLLDVLSGTPGAEAVLKTITE